MAHAYTPGLQVIEKTIIDKQRTLPIPGEVLVKVGDFVSASDKIARTEIPNDVFTVNIINQLGITPEEIREYMLKKEGDDVVEGEPIAENKPFLGLKIFKTVIKSPISGKIENVSEITGQVIIRKPPKELSLNAYIDGKVIQIEEKTGATIEAGASIIQGIFGIGGEKIGDLETIVNSPDDVVTESMINDSHKGKLLIGGSLLDLSAYQKARKIGVNGIIVGGFHAKDLKQILGYELGVAITGDEDIETTLILTEGFGKIRIAERTFNLLKKRNKCRASISGRTQIRAGVMRPEIIIPFPKEQTSSIKSHISKSQSGIQIGDEVRIIREPYFGMLGKIVSLPPELLLVETESKVRVMEISLRDGMRIIVPRANVEIIET